VYMMGAVKMALGKSRFASADLLSSTKKALRAIWQVATLLPAMIELFYVNIRCYGCRLGIKDS